jgi:hypothetical protein
VAIAQQRAEEAAQSALMRKRAALPPEPSGANALSILAVMPGNSFSV